MTTLDLITKEDLLEFKSELFAELRRMGMPPADGRQQKRWLRSVEVRKLLNISSGTLQSFRINGVLGFTKVGGIMYYKHEDIEKILETNLSLNARP